MFRRVAVLVVVVFRFPLSWFCFFLFLVFFFSSSSPVFALVLALLLFSFFSWLFSVYPGSRVGFFRPLPPGCACRRLGARGGGGVLSVTVSMWGDRFRSWFF